MTDMSAHAEICKRAAVCVCSSLPPWNCALQNTTPYCTLNNNYTTTTTTTKISFRLQHAPHAKPPPTPTPPTTNGWRRRLHVWIRRRNVRHLRPHALLDARLRPRKHPRPIPRFRPSSPVLPDADAAANAVGAEDADDGLRRPCWIWGAVATAERVEGDAENEVDGWWGAGWREGTDGESVWDGCYEGKSACFDG